MFLERATFLVEVPQKLVSSLCVHILFFSVLFLHKPISCHFDMVNHSDVSGQIWFVLTTIGEM